MRRQDRLGPLGVLGAVGEERDRGLRHAQRDARVGAPHLGELHQHVGARVGVGAHVGEDGLASRHAWKRAGDRRPLDALNASDVERRRGEDGTGGPGGEEAVRLPCPHAGAAPHDARVPLGAHRVRGMLVHAYDLGRDERAHPLVGRGEGNHHVLVAHDEDAQVPVGLKRLPYALEDDPGLLVSPHGVNADGGHVLPPPCRCAACTSKEGGRPRLGPASPGLVCQEGYSVTTTSRSL